VRKPFNKEAEATLETRETGVESFVDTRRGARTVALQVLYEVDSVGHHGEDVCERYVQENHLSTEAASFAIELVKGVLTSRERLDGIISEFAPSWPVAQLLVVDRNLLRLAIYELMLEKTTPPKAVINETVELAKLFGSENSFKFINGVLGTVMESAKL
jgi:N utilization substance protein B